MQPEMMQLNHPSKQLRLKVELSMHLWDHDLVWSRTTMLALVDAGSLAFELSPAEKHGRSDFILYAKRSSTLPYKRSRFDRRHVEPRWPREIRWFACTRWLTPTTQISPEPVVKGGNHR